MARGKKSTDKSSENTSPSPSTNLGFETKLWAAADALRNNMGATEYKHVVMGLIFLTCEHPRA